MTFFFLLLLLLVVVQELVVAESGMYVAREDYRRSGSYCGGGGVLLRARLGCCAIVHTQCYSLGTAWCAAATAAAAAAVVHRWDDGALFTALHPFPFSSANVCTLLTKQTMYSTG